MKLKISENETDENATESCIKMKPIADSAGSPSVMISGRKCMHNTIKKVNKNRMAFLVELFMLGNAFLCTAFWILL